jgi:hypothetical protein
MEIFTAFVLLCLLSSASCRLAESAFEIGAIEANSGIHRPNTVASTTAPDVRDRDTGTPRISSRDLSSTATTPDEAARPKDQGSTENDIACDEIAH